MNCELMLGPAGQRFKNTIHATVAIVATCLAGVAASPMQSPLVQGRLNPRIGIAAPERYASVRDANDWKNPYLVIRADGIEVTAKLIASGQKIVQAADLEQTLLGLAVAAWPCGRVVAVQENLRAPDHNDDAAVAQNLTTAVAVLTKLDVVVMRWPGA